MIDKSGFLISLSALIGLVHFLIPVLYYRHAKGWLVKPDFVLTNEIFEPPISIIVPTFNEARFIEGKLTNILEDNYPRELLEIVIIDSASIDGTVDTARSWSGSHRDLCVKIIEESVRKGKLLALLRAFDSVSSLDAVVLVTDADVRWEKGTIRKAAKYFADPSVGAVTASLVYSGNHRLENAYRNFYNVLRIAESSRHSTPIQSGAFQALRARILKDIGVPTFPGSDDCAFASYIAFTGYRSLQVGDILVREPMRGNQFFTKVRRAQHVILNFLFTKEHAKKEGIYHKTDFDFIWEMEFWLTVVNPWLLLVALLLLMTSLVLKLQLSNLMIVILSGALVVFEPYRVWVCQQGYLILGSLRNLMTRKETW